MNRKLFNITLFLIAALLTACSDLNTWIDDTLNNKTPIELSVGGVDAQAMTRAVITDGTGKTMQNFDKDTKIFMVMKSEYGAEDYQGSKKDKYTVSRGEVKASSTAITFDNLNQKYWDDAHARSSQLEIWAFAQQANWDNYTFEVPDDNWDKTDQLKEYKDYTYVGTTSYPWWEHTAGVDLGSRGPVYPCIMVWKVTNTPWAQTATTIQNQDLMFSNNLTKHGENAEDDKRLKFNFSTRKFDGGEMKFYHAMSKITINIIEGDGFDKTSADKDKDFQFATGTNVKFPQDVFNTQGTFNIKNGYFEKVDNHNAITSIALTSPKGVDPNPYYTLQALAIPNINGVNGLTDNYSRFVQNDTKVVMEFTIDNNTYKITSSDLYLALHGKTGATETTSGIIPLEAGKNYVFTFTISKTKISGITAKVVDWETVTANNITASNARISLLLEDRGTSVTENIEFYRAKDPGNTSISDSYEGYEWQSGYEKGTGSFDGITWKPTNWYWPDNTTFYHFRAVGDKSTSSPAAPTVTNDAFTLTAGQTYKDYIWGAPFKELDSPNPGANTATLTYSTTKGFDGKGAEAATPTHQIYHGIGPTTDPIKLLMFHMMSDVTINVESVTGDAAVTLEDGGNKTTIKFENIYTQGSVAMGNGLVSTSGTATTTGNLEMSTTTPNQWHYGAVPQDLDGPTTATTDDVILVITTPDKNEYRVSMKDVLASSVSTTNIANPYNPVDAKYKIDYWYPGVKYSYTFKLSKKKIESITATILEWENVTAGDDNVQIK